MPLYKNMICLQYFLFFSIGAFSNHELMNKFLMHPYSVKHNNEWWRFITSGFLHANWMHLFFNMFVLWSFGNAVESLYGYAFGEKGNYFFILLYVFGIIFSDLPSFAKWKDSYNYRSLGASGAVSAVLFAFIVFAPFEKILFMGVFPMPAILWGVAYLLYSAYASKQSRDGINHDAHFAGAIFGIIFTVAMKPSLFIDFIQQIISQFN